jgi:hypothetical protein
VARSHLIWLRLTMLCKMTIMSYLLMCWQLSAAYYSSCYAYFNFFIAASCYFFWECSKAAPFIWEMASANYYCCWIGFFFRDCIWVYQIRPISAGADGREWKNIFHIIHINTNHTFINQLKTPATPTSTSKIVSKAKVSIFIQNLLIQDQICLRRRSALARVATHIKFKA